MAWHVVIQCIGSGVRGGIRACVDAGVCAGAVALLIYRAVGFVYRSISTTVK